MEPEQHECAQTHGMDSSPDPKVPTAGVQSLCLGLWPYRDSTREGESQTGFTEGELVIWGSNCRWMAAVLQAYSEAALIEYGEKPTGGGAPGQPLYNER